MISLRRNSSGRSPVLSRRGRLLFFAAACVAAGLGAAAYPRILELRLARELRKCEHVAAGPRARLTAMLGSRAVPYFSRLLNDRESGTRLQALEALVELLGPAAADRLVPMMTDSYARIRERLVEQALIWDHRGMDDLLLAASRDADTWVRAAAVAGLSSRVRRRGERAPAVLEALAAAVEDPDLGVQSAAMAAMRAAANRDFGYRVRSTPSERRDSIRRWRRWWRVNRPDPIPELPDPVRPRRADPARSFAVSGLDGERWTLASARGRVVILHFFGTWCGSCVEEMADLEKLHRERPQVLVLALGVSESGPEALRAYAREHGLTYPLALAPRRMLDDYGDLHEVPVTFVLDAAGRLRTRFDGARDLATLRAACDAASLPGG